jgi:hypothetical protein
MKLTSARSRRSALLRPRCARLTALTAPSANLMRQLSTAHASSVLIDTHWIRDTGFANLLTPRIGGVIVKASFAGCASQPPPRRQMRSTRIAGHRSRFVLFSLHTPWSPIRVTIRPRITQSAPDCAVVHRSPREIRPLDAHACTQHEGCARPRSSVVNRHTATATRLSVADALGAALSAAQPQQNEYVNRHRRSTWAGVSWPNDDEQNGRGGEGKGSAFALTRTTKSMRAWTITCALSCAPSRVKPRVKCSRRK